MSGLQQSVLILGAGINGAVLARAGAEWRFGVPGRHRRSGLWGDGQRVAPHPRRPALSRIRRVRPGARVARRANAPAAPRPAVRQAAGIVHTHREPLWRAVDLGCEIPVQGGTSEAVTRDETALVPRLVARAAGAPPIRHLRPRPGAATARHAPCHRLARDPRRRQVSLAVFLLRCPDPFSGAVRRGPAGRRAAGGRGQRGGARRSHLSPRHARRSTGDDLRRRPLRAHPHL